MSDSGNTDRPDIVTAYAQMIRDRQLTIARNRAFDHIASYFLDQPGDAVWDYWQLAHPSPSPAPPGG